MSTEVRSSGVDVDVTVEVAVASGAGVQARRRAAWPFRLRHLPLTSPPAPRHLAETPTERTRTLEAEAHIYGHEGFGRHALPPVTEAEWDVAMGGVLR